MDSQCRLGLRKSLQSVFRPTPLAMSAMSIWSRVWSPVSERMSLPIRLAPGWSRCTVLTP
jgi:hypothetical protein